MIKYKELNRVSLFIAIICCFLFTLSFFTGCGEANSTPSIDDETIDKPIDKPIDDKPIVEEKPIIQELPMSPQYVLITVRTTPGPTYVYYITDAGTKIEHRYWQVDISVSPARNNIIFKNVQFQVGESSQALVRLNEQGYGTASFTGHTAVNEIYSYGKYISNAKGSVLILE